MEKTLNKKVAKFSYKGNYYEIDWLTDADRENGIRTYEIFKGKGKNAESFRVFESKDHNKNFLIMCAKQEIDN